MQGTLRAVLLYESFESEGKHEKLRKALKVEGSFESQGKGGSELEEDF